MPDSDLHITSWDKLQKALLVKNNDSEIKKNLDKLKAAPQKKEDWAVFTYHFVCSLLNALNDEKHAYYTLLLDYTRKNKLELNYSLVEQDNKIIKNFLINELKHEKFEKLAGYLNAFKEMNIVIFKQGLDVVIEAAKREPEKHQGKIIEALLKVKLLLFLPSTKKKLLLDYFKKNNESGKNSKNIKSLLIEMEQENKINLSKKYALAQLEKMGIHNENASRSIGFISGLVLPSQSTYISKEQNLMLRNNVINHIKDNDNPNLVFKPFKVETQDKAAVLDTLEIVNENISSKNRKYIINFGGNNQAYENDISNMIAESTRLKSNVIGFNYRGVAQSKGNPSSKQKLLEDGVAQVQRLLDQGVDPSRITLKGHSLGGSIAVSVAKYFSDKKPSLKLYVYSDRTFSTLTKATVGFIQNYFEEKNWPRLGKVLAFLATGIVKPLLMLAGFDMNAASDYKAIDENHKDYIVVKATKKAKSLGTDDRLIHPDASLHKALKPERQVLKQQIIDKLGENAKHMLKYNKMSAPLTGLIGHNVGLADLKNESSMTGTELFDHFFNSQGKVKNKVEQLQLLYQKKNPTESHKSVIHAISKFSTRSKTSYPKPEKFPEQSGAKTLTYSKQHESVKDKITEKPIVRKGDKIKPGKK